MSSKGVEGAPPQAKRTEQLLKWYRIERKDKPPKCTEIVETLPQKTHTPLANAMRHLWAITRRKIIDTKGARNKTYDCRLQQSALTYSSDSA